MKIEIKPNTGMMILSFLREFVKKGENVEYHFEALAECINEFEEEFIKNMSDSLLEEAMNEAEFNAMIGKSPPMRNGGR